MTSPAKHGMHRQNRNACYNSQFWDVLIEFNAIVLSFIIISNVFVQSFKSHPVQINLILSDKGHRLCYPAILP